MKTILVFKDGELFKNITYKTKKEAKGNYRIWKKHGMSDPDTGEIIKNLTFELI